MSQPRQHREILERLGVRVLSERFNKHIYLECEGPAGEHFKISMPHSPKVSGRVLANYQTYVERKMRGVR